MLMTCDFDRGFVLERYQWEGARYKAGSLSLRCTRNAHVNSRGNVSRRCLVPAGQLSSYGRTQLSKPSYEIRRASSHSK